MCQPGCLVVLLIASKRCMCQNGTHLASSTGTRIALPIRSGKLADGLKSNLPRALQSLHCSITLIKQIFMSLPIEIVCVLGISFELKQDGFPMVHCLGFP